MNDHVGAPAPVDVEVDELSTSQVTPATAETETKNPFAAWGLSQQILDAIALLGFQQPTAVQSAVVPGALKGGDWMVSSQTGSGKTLAFLLPCLDPLIKSLAERPQAEKKDTPPQAGGRRGFKPSGGMSTPAALVLCPTRELAQQVTQDAINLVKTTRGLRVATVVGGMPFMKQIAALQGAQLVIATPGRLLDLVRQRKLSMTEVKTLVLDEADRMLDLGFSEDLAEIDALCKGRQRTLMFSATFAPNIMVLAERLMTEPQRIALSQAGDQHEHIEQKLFWANDAGHKSKLLSHWLAQDDIDQAIVFASTQADTEVLAEELEARGVSAAALHGAMPQAVRNRRLNGLRQGQIKVLVATDVAARGIDIATISHVFNYGLPMKPEDYVHRIGRTGRAGRDGLAVTLAQHSERRKVIAIERYIKRPLPVAEIPGLEPRPMPRHVPKEAGRPGGRSRPRGMDSQRSGGYRQEGQSAYGEQQRGYRSAEGRAGGGQGRFGEARGQARDGQPRGDGQPRFGEGRFNADRAPYGGVSRGDAPAGRGERTGYAAARGRSASPSSQPYAGGQRDGEGWRPVRPRDPAADERRRPTTFAGERRRRAA